MKTQNSVPSRRNSAGRRAFVALLRSLGALLNLDDRPVDLRSISGEGVRCFASASGGPIAFVRDGDLVRIDVPTKSLDLLVDEAELASRRVGWQPLPARYPSGVLGKYARLRSGDFLLGTWLTLLDPAVTELLAGSGFDFLVADGEHGPVATADLVPMLIAARTRGVPILYRVAANEPVRIMHALDAGAAGVVVPQIRTVADAERAVAWCRYPPVGLRGIAPRRASEYGRRTADYLRGANELDTCCIQVETREAYEELDAILAVPGVDAILVGPNDFSAALGHTGDLAHPEVEAVLDSVPEAPPLAPGPAPVVLVHRLDHQRIEVEVRSEGPALLMLSQPHVPGWQATVNGAPTPILHADYALQAVAVPDGASQVTLEYRPRTLLLGAGITAITLLLAIAAWIKWDSPGPVLHRRRVLGVSGHQFDAFKFRTMHTNGEELLARDPEALAELRQNHKLKRDPRITHSGQWLRRYSLDEIPQLLNVLIGQMSLVGPRMITADELAKYGDQRVNLLTVKPGITGLWQVSGRSDLSYDERVRMDMFYVRNYSVWLDLQILFVHTLPAVIKGRGAY